MSTKHSGEFLNYALGDLTVRQRVIRPGHVAPVVPAAGEKRCYTCRTIKSTDEFYRRSYGRKGCMPNCKHCHIKAVQRNSYHNI